jgi:hypothetical protein
MRRSVPYRTGLGYAETEIGKWRGETGAAKPPVQSRKSGICRPETRARQPNPPECRQFSRSRKSNRRDRTGWLGWEDSNSQMSLPKLAFEVWPEFPFISQRLAIRDFSRLSCQRVTCTPVQSISAMNMARRSPLRRGQAMLERRLLWIREFESSHPSQPASQCGLSYSISGCASTADIPAGYAGAPESLAGKFRTFGSEPSGFAAPVSARHFPISVSACPRPVRYVTETGLRSRFRACTAAKVERWIDCPVRGKARRRRSWPAEPRIAYQARRRHEICGFEILLT